MWFEYLSSGTALNSNLPWRGFHVQNWVSLLKQWPKTNAHIATMIRWNVVEYVSNGVDKDDELWILLALADWAKYAWKSH